MANVIVTTAEPGEGAGAVWNSAACPICAEREVKELLTAPDRFHLRNKMYSLLRCSACTCVWLSNPPASEELAFHYDQDYHNAIMAAGEGSAEQRWKNHRKRISCYKTEGSLLDIGCSSGAFLSTMTNGRWSLHGIEMEASSAEKARAVSRAEVFVGDVLEAPFFPESFDVITCFDVIEHVYSPVKLLARILKWLKPGGIFYAMLPNIDSWEARLFGSYWYGLELPRHVSHFSPRSLRQIMALSGFEEISVTTPGISYAERSVDYLYSALVERFGVSATPQARPKSRSLIDRAIRKAIRLTVIEPAAQMASLVNAGPSMEAVFKKPA